MMTWGCCSEVYGKKEKGEACPIIVITQILKPSQNIILQVAIDEGTYHGLHCGSVEPKSYISHFVILEVVGFAL
jgi:hypothetical protein